MRSSVTWIARYFFFFLFFVSLFGEKVDDAGGDGDYYTVINRRWMFMHSEEM